MGDGLTKNAAKIAIIGGGYSGMAAAVRVVERGGVPTVFEVGRVLGGRARRIESQGRVLDNGQHILSGAYRELLRLMDVIGLSASVYARVPLTLTMPPDFQLRAPLLPAPLHMAAALLMAKGLSFSDRFKAIRMMRALEKAQFLVSAKLTVAELLTQYTQSPRLVEYLWQPLTISALNTPIRTASAQVFVNVLRDALGGAREASDLLLPKVDLSALFPEPAAKWVCLRGGEIRLATKVSAINTDANKVVVTSNSAGESREDHFDAVIIAVGPHQRDGLLPAVSGKNVPNSASNNDFSNLRQTSETDAQHYEPITTIYFGFETADNLAHPMFGQPRGIAQWFFDRRQLSNAPESNELVVAAVISASGLHDEMDNETLAGKVLAELKVHQPNLPNPAWNKVIREKFATFACTPDAPRPSHLTAAPRLFLAGDDVANPIRNYPATLEGTVRNGVAAADAAIAFLTT